MKDTSSLWVGRPPGRPVRAHVGPMPGSVGRGLSQASAPVTLLGGCHDPHPPEPRQEELKADCVPEELPYHLSFHSDNPEILRSCPQEHSFLPSLCRDLLDHY